VDHSYQFARATNQVPIQGFPEIGVAKVNLLRGLANPAKKHVGIYDQTITIYVLSISKRENFLPTFTFSGPNS